MPLPRKCDLDIDWAAGRLWVATGRGPAQPCGQIATADLVRRPPQVVKGDRPLAGAAGEVVLEMNGLLSGEEHSAQHRLERLRVQGCVHACRDVPGSRIRLLGGDP